MAAGEQAMRRVSKPGCPRYGCGARGSTNKTDHVSRSALSAPLQSTMSAIGQKGHLGQIVPVLYGCPVRTRTEPQAMERRKHPRPPQGPDGSRMPPDGTHALRYQRDIHANAYPRSGTSGIPLWAESKPPGAPPLACAIASYCARRSSFVIHDVDSVDRVHESAYSQAMTPMLAKYTTIGRIRNQNRAFHNDKGKTDVTAL